MAMLLETVTPAVEHLEESAWLAPVSGTFPIERRSAGAVNSPRGRWCRLTKSPRKYRSESAEKYARGGVPQHLRDVPS